MVPKEKRKTYNTNTINENQQILKHYLVCILPLIPQVKRCNSNPPPPTLKNIKKMYLCTRMEDSMRGLRHFL